MKIVENEFKIKEAKEFYKAILMLKDEKECELFLRDIFTFEELQEVIRRFKVVKMLIKGIIKTEEIRNENMIRPNDNGKKLVVFIFLDHYICLRKIYAIMREMELIYPIQSTEILL